MTVRTVELYPNVTKRVLDANKDRIAYTLENTGTVNIFMGHDQQVAISGFFKGLVVSAAGGNREDRWHKGEVWCIASITTEITYAEDTPIFFG